MNAKEARNITSTPANPTRVKLTLETIFSEVKKEANNGGYYVVLTSFSHKYCFGSSKLTVAVICNLRELGYTVKTLNEGAIQVSW